MGEQEISVWIGHLEMEKKQATNPKTTPHKNNPTKQTKKPNTQTHSQKQNPKNNPHSQNHKHTHKITQTKQTKITLVILAG